MPRVLVIDQFEELFYFISGSLAGSGADSFPKLKILLDQDPNLRVLFVIREDYLAELDPLPFYLPEQLDVRYRLERLDRDAALEAITEPLSADYIHTNRTFGTGVAEQLVSSLLAIEGSSPTDTAPSVEETVRRAGTVECGLRKIVDETARGCHRNRFGSS